jgi:pimeloyl-ACP methyl ester carboxylesterase
MKFAFAVFAVAAALCAAQPATSAPAAKPTIVLVHGAFADASSWNSVVGLLLRDGYRVIAPPNFMRCSQPSRRRSCWSAILTAAW